MVPLAADVTRFIESALGRGTLFCIKFPIQVSPKQKEAG